MMLSHSSGSDGAQIAVETACRNGFKQSIYPLSNTEDVIIEVNMKGDGPCVGQDVMLSIIMKNKCRSPRSLTLYSQVAAMYYTGAQKALVKKDKTLIELKSYEGETWWKLEIIILRRLHS